MVRIVYTLTVALAISLAAGGPFAAEDATDAGPPMIAGLDGWSATPILTIGDSVAGYTPLGKPDGMGAFRLDGNGGRVRVFINHELMPGQGYGYSLPNGTTLTGARISYLDIDAKWRAVIGAGLAYDAIVDAEGTLVVDAGQVNETGHASDGMGRFCSGRAVTAGTLGLVDNVYFASEEMSTKRRAKGGLVWAL